ncbi:hypothetical protein STRIP9103_07773 [Streptomyces ipomoeae 91-03]|uniref:Uncharacterized protein n=1 Tax=Streptomyces ipomoeae 91-03 TaxID=698759 RepID=L1KX18_9ACTN|nr:hypothetical protein STRIP9103_07773 [Streptomyces ipomoeae 91-03]
MGEGGRGGILLAPVSGTRPRPAEAAGYPTASPWPRPHPPVATPPPPAYRVIRSDTGTTKRGSSCSRSCWRQP